MLTSILTLYMFRSCFVEYWFASKCNKIRSPISPIKNRMTMFVVKKSSWKLAQTEYVLFSSRIQQIFRFHNIGHTQNVVHCTNSIKQYNWKKSAHLYQKKYVLSELTTSHLNNEYNLISDHQTATYQQTLLVSLRPN